MKTWAKTRANGDYHSHNIAHAVAGFRELGAEIVKYEKIDEIYQWVTKDDIVLDYIDQCLTIFDKFGKHPHLEDYPEVLKPFLGRAIWKDTINHINSDPSTWGIFVKPLKEKAFIGRVVNGTKDLVGCGSCYENYDVFCSEIINIKAEWRCFIYYDKILDIRPYGFSSTEHWRYHYDIDIVDDILSKFITWQDRPVACSIDIGVIEKDNKYTTVLIEVNDCYALGCYGLDSIHYAKMISARWSQILGREDEYHFSV